MSVRSATGACRELSNSDRRKLQWIAVVIVAARDAVFRSVAAAEAPERRLLSIQLSGATSPWLTSRPFTFMAPQQAASQRHSAPASG